MAVTVAVVTAGLPTSGTVDFTRTDFGTPDAAIIIVNRAYSGGNPADNNAGSVGFWDGTPSQVACGWRAEHGQANSDTARVTDTSYAGPVLSTTADSTAVVYSFAATTNGLQASIASGSTTISRYATVILFKGLKSKKVGSFSLNGTTPVAVDVGFKPTALFTVTAWQVSAEAATQSIFSFGVASNNTAGLKQYNVQLSSVDNSADGLVNSSISNDCIGRIYYNDGAASEKLTVSDFQDGATANFDIVSDGARTPIVGYLAFELNDPDEFYLTDFAANTSGTTPVSDAKSGFGFEPIAAGIATVRGTSFNSTSNSPTGSLSIGAADTSGQACHVWSDEDAQATSDTSAYYDASNLIVIQDHNASTDAVASVTTWGSDGLTLSWSDNASAADKYFLWAIGADSSSGISGTLSKTLDSLTSSATGTVALAGVAGITLDAATTSATGTLALQSQAAITFGDVAVAAIGAVDIAATLGVTLGDITLSAAGTVVDSGIPVLSAATVVNITSTSASPRVTLTF